MMVKGFGAWNVAIRLLPKRFDTTNTHRGHSAILLHGSYAPLQA
jgi:hypothetical protein